MEQNNNKYIAASYALYDVTDGKKELVEETIRRSAHSSLSVVLVLRFLLLNRLW